MTVGIAFLNSEYRIRTGTDFLIEYMSGIKNIGVNHIALNLRFNSGKIEDALETLSQKVLPQFHNQKTKVHNE